MNLSQCFTCKHFRPLAIVQGGNECEAFKSDAKYFGAVEICPQHSDRDALTGIFKRGPGEQEGG